MPTKITPLLWKYSLLIAPTNGILFAYSWLCQEGKADPWENRTSSYFLHSIFQGFQWPDSENIAWRGYVGKLLSHVDLGQTHLFSLALAERLDHKGEEKERAWEMGRGKRLYNHQEVCLSSWLSFSTSN